MPTSSNLPAHANVAILTNGHGGPDDAKNHRLGEAITRMILGRKITKGTAKALRQADPPEWGDLAKEIEDSEGYKTPEKRAEFVDLWLKRHEARSKKTAIRSIRKAIAEAAKKAEAEGIEDEQEEPSGPPPFRLKTIDSATFFGKKYSREWLVRQILALGQACIIGGPKKTLKTSLLIDLAVSLAEALPFLGVFAVPQRMRVGFFSGESGEATIQETALRVCESKGISPSVLDNVIWGFDLPQLSNEEHLAELGRVIRETTLQVVIIDPLYLCLIAGNSGRQLDTSNLYHMGPLLASVAKTCLDAGATPCLIHHFRKNREQPYEPPELEDLAFAGIQEFARQWILVGRQEKYESGTGTHKLWLRVGGSAGHDGLWALRVDEGVMEEDFGKRRWEVSLRGATEARDEFTQIATSAKVAKQVEQGKVRDEAKERADAMAVVDLATLLGEQEGRKITDRKLRGAVGWNVARFRRIVERAVARGWFRRITIPTETAKGKTEDCPGYELIKDPGVIE